MPTIAHHLLLTTAEPVDDKKPAASTYDPQWFFFQDNRKQVSFIKGANVTHELSLTDDEREARNRFAGASSVPLKRVPPASSGGSDGGRSKKQRREG